MTQFSKALIILFALFGVCHSNAQTVSTSQLIGTKWKEVSSDSDEETWEFEEDSLSIDLYYDDDKSHIKYKEAYYVASNEPSSFSNASVGQKQSGQYIVVLNSFTGMDYYKVKEFDKQKKVMVLYHRPRYDMIGGRGNVDVKYELIK